MQKLDDITQLPADTQFEIAKPNGRGSLFRLRYRQGSTGPRQYFDLEEIDIANRLWLDGTVDFDTTYSKLKDIRAQLYSKRDRPRLPSYNTHNLAILERYWNARYRARRQSEMRSPHKSREDLERAIAAVDPYPLDTHPISELENTIYERFKDNKPAMRKRILWVNSILSYLGRDKIDQCDKEVRDVTYLNEEDFTFLMGKLDDPFGIRLCRIAFYTGLRLGEIFGLQVKDIKEESIYVVRQMYGKENKKHAHEYGPTKSKRTPKRDAILPDTVRKDVLTFANLPITTKKEMRDVQYCKVLQKLCRKYWPDDHEKHLNFHALRHCNAIWLLSKGASLYEVAQHLGNEYTVTEEYYHGFVLKKETVSRLHKIVS